MTSSAADIDQTDERKLSKLDGDDMVLDIAPGEEEGKTLFNMPAPENYQDLTVLAVSFDEATEVESTKYHYEEKAIRSTNNVGLPS